MAEDAERALSTRGVSLLAWMGRMGKFWKRINDPGGCLDSHCHSSATQALSASKSHNKQRDSVDENESLSL
jgi:hypothetical protein